MAHPADLQLSAAREVVGRPCNMLMFASAGRYDPLASTSQEELYGESPTQHEAVFLDSSLES
eukprot:2812270-Pyramimonas_sp.AAC.1